MNDTSFTINLFLLIHMIKSLWKFHEFIRFLSFLLFTFHILYPFTLCKNVIKMQEFYKVPDEGARKVALGSLPGLSYKVKKAL